MVLCVKTRATGFGEYFPKKDMMNIYLSNFNKKSFNDILRLFLNTDIHERSHSFLSRNKIPTKYEEKICHKMEVFK